jgi:hypothetical protein
MAALVGPTINIKKKIRKKIQKLERNSYPIHTSDIWAANSFPSSSRKKKKKNFPFRLHLRSFM